MDYNNSLVTIGKVRTYDSITGKIISKEGIYIFTQENISDGEKINVNDIVLFRGEEINNIKVAYFIRKLKPNKNINDQIHIKTKNIKLIRGNRE